MQTTNYTNCTNTDSVIKSYFVQFVLFVVNILPHLCFEACRGPRFGSVARHHHLKPDCPASPPGPRPPLSGVLRFGGAAFGGSGSSGSGPAFFAGSGRACKALSETLIRCCSGSTDST